MAQMTIVEALRQAIREEMQRDPRVCCIGEDIGVKGGWGGQDAKETALARNPTAKVIGVNAVFK